MTILTPTIVELTNAEFKVILALAIEKHTGKKFIIEDFGFANKKDTGEPVVHLACSPRQCDLVLPAEK